MRIKKVIKDVLIIIGFLILLIIAICAIGGFVFFMPKYEKYKDEAKKAIETSTIDTFKQNLTTYIYDDSDNLLVSLSPNGDKIYLKYDEIPQDVVNAFIAIEDNRFWEHKGVDFKGLVRVGINYIKTRGKEKHGASTITQQLVRNIFISREVTLDRKIKEICYALEMEEKYSKKDIMEFYINNIYYGNNCYGIESAANFYFDKPASELSLSECAYLCAIPNSPTYYDPTNDQSRAIPRRDKILYDMLNLGYITEVEYAEATNEDIVINVKENKELNNYQTTYAVDCATRYLMRKNGFEFKYHFDSKDSYEIYQDLYEDEYNKMKKQLYTGGYTIKTTLNNEKQILMQNSIDKVLGFSDEEGKHGQYALQGAATLINNETGKVEAIVGGRSQENTTYTLNRAFQSYRQPGSSIKPLIVYTPALEHGYTDSSIVENISIDAAKKHPKQVKNLTGAQMTLRTAVENSKNGVAWKVFDDITPTVGLAYIERMCFAKVTIQDYVPAASLGGFTYGTTTTEMANAYSTLVNHGVFRETDCISSILDKNGKEIYEEPEEEVVYQEDSADLMINILKGVVTKGTAKKMGWSGTVEAAGKTGTTNKSKDGWFAGVTPDYSMTVWVGYDTPKELSNLYGGTYPAKIWKNTMEELIKDSSNKKFETAKEKDNKNEKYLPGRSDDEDLSDGYTVGDYRDDHALADEANTILDKIAEGAYEKSEIMVQYEEARNIIEQIYGQTLKGEERAKLNEIYEMYLK